ncbi:MAG: GTPase HflX [Neisseria sp.]|uniref:GTPase HflX n=1 Tax=Neisseria sp. TaxID=192066 RepID=UPI0026DBF907|nr:GTPase HflX [Neisseria sp.]MDO4249644.1 GTPase HflX [Neisseria sp.]
MLVGVMLSADYSGANETRERSFQAALAEAAELVAATGGELVDIQTAKRDKAHSALFVGTGKAEELALAVRAHEIELVVFNHELTPTQERNLEKTLQCRVLDRVGLILAIFAQRAQSQEGKLQVELAQLTHLSGRLVRGYGHLQSQKGGIGLKGPGETQLETDRRLISQKITALKRQLANVEKQRATRRKARMGGQLKTFALVGYTNTGKSSLFNRLTKADVLAKDQLFATLDTTARRLYLSPECSVILTDTVGFVRDLPHGLVAAFSATLEETALADVLLHVVDAAHPEFERQIDDVNEVLQEIGAGEVPQLVVYNKIDLLPAHTREAGILRNAQGAPIAVNISVKEGWGLDALRQAMVEAAL